MFLHLSARKLGYCYSYQKQLYKNRKRKNALTDFHVSIFLFYLYIIYLIINKLNWYFVPQRIYICIYIVESIFSRRIVNIINIKHWTNDTQRVSLYSFQWVLPQKGLNRSICCNKLLFDNPREKIYLQECKYSLWQLPFPLMMHMWMTSLLINVYTWRENTLVYSVIQSGNFLWLKALEDFEFLRNDTWQNNACFLCPDIQCEF